MPQSAEKPASTMKFYMTSKKYVSARDGENNSVIYKAADGTEELHSGGSRAWRNNNPGNLISAEKSGLAIGKGGRFAVFPDHDAGFAALKMTLVKNYSDMKLDKVFQKYAPASDKNNPEQYIAQVKKWTGLDSARALKDLDEAELLKFMKAIERAEGWIVGKITPVPHAQQFVVKGVDGKPISNMDYLIDFFRKDGTPDKAKGSTNKDGKTAVIKTNIKSPVTLTLPRPDPGSPLKAAKGKPPPGGMKVVAAQVTAKPWYAFAFSTAEASNDPKDGPASEPKQAATVVAPLAVVKQAGAVKVSGTVDKEKKFVQPVVVENGVFVTWKFDTSGGSGKVLNTLPYIVVKIEGGTASLLLEGDKVELMRNNIVRRKVPRGTEVALFLGSDAKEKYRSAPMFKVLAEDGFTDIVVKVAEKRGLDYSAALEIPHAPVVAGTKKTYSAELHGTSWMKFSHKYAEAEAEQMTASAKAEVQRSVKQIYSGTATVGGGTIRLSVTKPNQQTLKIVWPAEAFGNCMANIPSVPDLDACKSEIIARVNPRTYQAFVEAAFEIDAEEMVISSGWRPMLGSILHRIGVGLDVKKVTVNGSPKVFNRGPTAEENTYHQAIAERKQLEKFKKNGTITPEQTARLNVLKAEEPGKLERASDAITNNEAAVLKAFTKSLRGNAHVRQTFDPWEMDVNTRDNKDATQNDLSDSNEKLHKNHLHITVVDPELGHG